MRNLFRHHLVYIEALVIAGCHPSWSVKVITRECTEFKQRSEFSDSVSKLLRTSDSRSLSFRCQWTARSAVWFVCSEKYIWWWYWLVQCFIPYSFCCTVGGRIWKSCPSLVRHCIEVFKALWYHQLVWRPTWPSELEGGNPIKDD